MGVHAAILTAMFVSAAAAQLPARRSFEVATIKRNPNCHNGQRRPSPGRLDFACVSVRELLVISYGSLQGGPVQVVALDVLGGPSWIDTERYDLSAKAEDRSSVEEMVGPMLIGLLEDRLHLKAHLEPRETPVYALQLIERPHRLRPAEEGACKTLNPEDLPKSGDETRYCGTGRWRVEDGTVISELYGNTMAELASRGLPMHVGRRVIDQTGLTGRFDIHLEFLRAMPGHSDGVEVATDGGASMAPTIFTALQRLGLKLVPTKAPIDVVVIDSIERPSEN
jgi:uncharacterized protein (TIGR03435 family)